MQNGVIDRWYGANTITAAPVQRRADSSRSTTPRRRVRTEAAGARRRWWETRLRRGLPDGGAESGKLTRVSLLSGSSESGAAPGVVAICMTTTLLVWTTAWSGVPPVAVVHAAPVIAVISFAA